MFEERAVRIRINADGSASIIDPDPSALPIIQEFDPTFEVRREPLPCFSRPRLLTTLSTSSGLSREEIALSKPADLWLAHERAAQTPMSPGLEGASLLDLKIELARRMLRSCDLCGQRCLVDRVQGERGRCGLGTDAYVYEAYVHIAEEPPINPAFNVSLRGCGLRCRYCQQSDALLPRGEERDVLRPDTWAKLNTSEARSIAFVGGNPTESLPSVLEFLRGAPDDLSLPIVWNSHGYDSTPALKLLRGVCDAYIPDWKYGNDSCAVALSNAPNYTSVAADAIETMCTQNVPVFVRMLVLPGHVECCHLPALELLAPWRERVSLNVMAQYLPDFLIQPSDGALVRPARASEVARVQNVAAGAGFRLLSTLHDPAK